MNAILDGGCLAEVLGHLTDWGLCCARRVCTAWRDAASTAGVWRAVFEGMHGAHSVHWAAAHEPVALAPGDDEWRARCALRRRAATNRRRGLARARLLPFEMGPTAASSPFFVVSLAVDGPWLALGGHGHVSLHDLRTGKRCWQQPHAASAAGSDDSAHLVSMVTVCAVSGHVAALTPADGTVIVRSLTSGDLLHRVDHFELLRGLWGELTHLHGGVEVHTPAGRLERMCTYSPARLGLESGPEAGPLRLVTVAQLPEPGEDRDGELVPAPLVSLLWLLPTEADAAAPPKLLRAREGAMSEQAGVMAEVYLTPGPRADGPYELLLLDVLTLRPVGKAVLALRSEQAHAFDYADCMRKAPTFVSIQRRGERRWVFVLESPKPRSHGADAGVYLEVWSLRSRQSADEIRESHTAGGGGLLPAAQSLCDPEEALRTAPQLEASLLQVIDVASPLYIWGDEDRSSNRLSPSLPPPPSAVPPTTFPPPCVMAGRPCCAWNGRASTGTARRGSCTSTRSASTASSARGCSTSTLASGIWARRAPTWATASRR